MGQLSSLPSLLQRGERGNVEEVVIASSNAYKWPPKSGNYFGSHFIMGGERFDTPQPEAFLFGENTDLNFLGNRPLPFPYPVPQPNEPTRTLRSLVNIRKDSIRLIRSNLPDKADAGAGDGLAVPTEEAAAVTETTEDTDIEAAEVIDDATYNIEFTFDCDVTCSVTVYYFAREENVDGTLKYVPRDSEMNSETFRYKRGANQVFCQSTHTIKPLDFTEEEWQYDPDKEEIPIVIHCVVEDEDNIGHSHVTMAVLEKVTEGYSIKSIKQKQHVDGLVYILQEFYGIENKETEKAKPVDDELGDNTAECVICMSDIRDTLILPCRHLCLCYDCADSLRYQASNCPICRSPFRALLQLRAIRKKVNKENDNASEDDDDLQVSQKGVPQGYEAISLIEALNGPCSYKATAPPVPRIKTSQASLRRSKKSKKRDGKGSKVTLKEKELKDEKNVETKEKKSDEKINKDNEKSTEESTPDTDGTVDEKSMSDNSPAEKPVEEKSAKEDAAKFASEKVNAGTDDADRASERKPSKESNGEHEELERLHSSDSSGSDCDTLGLSAVSQNTTLPGTPDHVLDEEEIPEQEGDNPTSPASPK